MNYDEFDAFSNAQKKLNQIQEEYENMPETLADEVIQMVSGTSLGSSLSGQRDKLVEEFKRVGHTYAGNRAKQIAHFAQTTDGKLNHTVEFGSFISALDMILNEVDSDESRFIQACERVIPSIAAVGDDGARLDVSNAYSGTDVMDTHKNDAANSYSVSRDAPDLTREARAVLENENSAPEDREHYIKLIKTVTGMDIETHHDLPYSKAELEDQLADVGAQARVQNLYSQINSGGSPGSVNHQSNPKHSYLTDPEVGREHRELMERHYAMQAESEDDGFGEGGFNNADGGI